MDIKGYYPNMRHDVVKDVFRKHLEPFVFDAAARILDTFPDEVGFYPGSQIIQIAGMSVLNDIDHYAKEWLQVKHYVRYMDDILILGDSIEELNRIKDEIEHRLGNIGFEFNEKKTRITTIKSGVMYLGFKFRITDTGKVILTIDPKRVKAERKKLFRMARLANEGKMTRAKVDQCYASWRNHAAKGNSYHLLQKMDKYYDDLWR